MRDTHDALAEQYAAEFREHARRSGEVWCFHDHTDLEPCYDPECSVCLGGDTPKCPRCKAAV